MKSTTLKKENPVINLTPIRVEAEEIPLEEKIEQALVKENITDKVISELEERYSGLELSSIDDKETYLQIKEARKNVRTVGILVEKTCKKGRESAVKEQKLWLAIENKHLAKIAKVQDPLDAEIKRFDDEVERKEIEEKKRQEEQYMKRQAILNKYGATYSDGNFVLNHISYEVNLIKESDEEVWESIILPKYKAQFDLVQAEIVEQENKRQFEMDAMKKQREEFEEQQRQFKAQQQELKEAQDLLQKEKDNAARELQLAEQRKEAEAKKVLQKVIDSRVNQLYSLGMKPNALCDGYEFDIVEIGSETVNEYSISEWNSLISQLTPTIDELKKAIEEKRIALIENEKQLSLKRQAGKARFDTLKEMGYDNESEVNLSELSTPDWIKMYEGYKGAYDLKKRQEWLAEEKLKQELESQRKAEEMSKSKDKDKWVSFIQELNQIVIPQMNSGFYRGKLSQAKDKLEEIQSL